MGDPIVHHVVFSVKKLTVSHLAVDPKRNKTLNHIILPSDFCTVYLRSCYFTVLKEYNLFMMGCVGLVGLESLMRPEDWLTETFPWDLHCYCHCPSVNIPQENTIPISTLHTYSQHTSSISVLLAMAYTGCFLLFRKVKVPKLFH